ncbi:MAG: arginine deiminase family protein, partial [Propionibacteriales bacterium]|nr:arginine deiminase family protein [Propionibacteriales bacterium]
MSDTDRITGSVRSEVGRLRTVIVHRPGAELRRLTPRNNDALLFDGIPWVDRAQEEHDIFAELLRGRGVEVLILAELLTETLDDPAARQQAVDLTLTDLRVGDSLRTYLRERLGGLDSAHLAEVLMSGLRNDEVTGVRTVVTSLLAPDDFVIDPLPNLLFTRDSSVWIGDRVTITSLAMRARARETQITELVYTYHPRFVGTPQIHGWGSEHVEGGDVLALGDGVLAIGVGERTTPAGVERLTRTVFEQGLASTVLAVPIDQDRATMHLDTVVTLVDVDACVMYPNVADRMSAFAITSDGERLQVGERRPFLEAAADALGIDRFRVIDTGLDPVTAEREQWD